MLFINTQSRFIFVIYKFSYSLIRHPTCFESAETSENACDFMAILIKPHVEFVCLKNVCLQSILLARVVVVSAWLLNSCKMKAVFCLKAFFAASQFKCLSYDYWQLMVFNSTERKRSRIISNRLEKTVYYSVLKSKKREKILEDFDLLENLIKWTLNSVIFFLPVRNTVWHLVNCIFLIFCWDLSLLI